MHQLMLCGRSSLQSLQSESKLCPVCPVLNPGLVVAMLIDVHPNHRDENSDDQWQSVLPDTIEDGEVDNTNNIK